MTRGSARRWVRTAVHIVAVAAALVFVSFLSLEYYGRADLTARQEHTVSPSTRAILATLPDAVTVTVYLSRDLPQHMTGFRERVADVLDEYRAHGGDRLIVRFVDPAESPEEAERAARSGVLPVEIEAFEKDRAEIVAAYLAMTVRYENRQVVVPLLSGVGRLEYDLTSSIIKVVTNRRHAVGFLTGHGERSVRSEYALAASALAEHYDVREVDARDPASLAGLRTLIVAGAGHVPDAELYEVDQFIMRGGRAMFLLDGAVVDASTALRSQPAAGNVFDFAGSYGVVVNPDLVVDAVNSPATFQARRVQMSVPYPYWPKAAGDGISHENPIVSGFDAIPFPWTSSLTVKEPVEGGPSVTVLASSSDQSWTVPAHADLRPQAVPAQSPETAAALAAGRGGRIPLAAALRGRFRSAFAGRPVIREHRGRAEFTDPAGRRTVSAPTQIVVFGNARMFEDQLLRQFGGNLAVFMNAVDWLTLGDALLAIRAKRVEDRPLEDTSPVERAAARALGTFASPVGLALVGLARAAARRRRARAGAPRPDGGS